MAQIKNVRASDRSDFTNAPDSGFVARERVGIRRIYHACALAVMITIGVAILVYNDTLLGSMMCVLVGAITLSLGRQIENLQKMLQATEFMNALFSSALAKKSKFCVIVKRDGEIVYLNRAFQSMFPDFLHQSERTLDKLLSMHSVTSDNRQRIILLVGENIETVTLPVMLEKDGEKMPMSISIEPIERPSGFALVRGQ